MNIIETLKKLTNEQAIKIASIAIPDVKWELVKSEEKCPTGYEGIDLIEANIDPMESKHIFQIDFSKESILKHLCRFRYYKELAEYSIGYSIGYNAKNDILEFLKTNTI